MRERAMNKPTKFLFSAFAISFFLSACWFINEQQANKFDPSTTTKTISTNQTEQSELLSETLNAEVFSNSSVNSVIETEQKSLNDLGVYTVSQSDRDEFAELDEAVRAGDIDATPEYWEQRVAIERDDRIQLALLNGTQPEAYLLNISTTSQMM